ncbi:MAG: peptidoglycan bridge formation glycyltransferase FemA/FemB family protein [Bacteroidetes bacterium]|nr:peptidoglycan bridge formation glycyltransferase FemA/FemB family protein [Bacteroidota bacterium]
MIALTSKKLFLRRRVIYFATKPSFSLNPFDAYVQCSSTDDFPGFKRTAKYTKIVDLQQNEEDLLKGFDKNTAYEVRRAAKEGLDIRTDVTEQDFLELYNSFADKKQLGSVKDISTFRGHLQITGAFFENRTLVFHSYILDKDKKRVRLLHSASALYDEANANLKPLIGRANRYLHFMDMMYFKNEGFTEYDFGGYAKDTENESLKGINKFKDGFGGMLVEESNYESKIASLL